jgi:peptidoglycan-N-acetylmuramic acid deacetylase
LANKKNQAKTPQNSAPGSRPRNKYQARIRIYSTIIIATFMVMALGLGGYAYLFKEPPAVTSLQPEPQPGPNLPAEPTPEPVPNPEPAPSPTAPDNSPTSPAPSTPEPSSPAPDKTTLPANNDNQPQVPKDKLLQWYYVANNKHEQPFIPAVVKEMMAKYQGIYLGNAGEKKIYLTFDAGYENGYTGRILDVLAANQVKAAFFVTKPYITTQPELVKRMAAEGHLVGNHTATHPSLPKITDDQIKKELETTEAAFTAATGKEMVRMVRPPEGAFSEKTLASLQEMGYRAVFWSMAFRDWDVKKQPGADKAYENVINNIHPGAVILLHAVSSSNAEALNDIIYELKRQGYEFALLSEL